jgi:hypothetical protein
MKTKTFDCVEMKRKGAEYVYNIIKDMTPEEEVAYWRQQTETMRQRQATLRARNQSDQKTSSPTHQ